MWPDPAPRAHLPPHPIPRPPVITVACVVALHPRYKASQHPRPLQERRLAWKILHLASLGPVHGPFRGRVEVAAASLRSSSLVVLDRKVLAVSSRARAEPGRTRSVGGSTTVGNKADRARRRRRLRGSDRGDRAAGEPLMPFRARGGIGASGGRFSAEAGGKNYLPGSSINAKRRLEAGHDRINKVRVIGQVDRFAVGSTFGP